MNHPLKVYNPAGGIHFLLQWWSYNEQNHVIVARSEKALQSVFKHICAENSDGKIKRVLEVEFVAPSDEMCQQASEYKRKEEVKSFINAISWEAKKVYKHGFPLPSKFQICAEYVPPPDCYEEGETPSEYAIENHCDCLNCCNGIALVGETPESLYDKYHDAWMDINNKNIRIDQNLVYSHARKSENGEEIWAAWPCFGHHSAGVSLAPASAFEIAMLFYFTIRRELDITPWKDQIDEAKRKLHEQKRKEQEAFETKKLKRQNEDALKFLKIFNEE